MTATAITPFNFNNSEIRLIVRAGEPWFITADVARVLGYRDASNAGRVLDDDEKGTHIVSTPGGDQKLTVINESGLYALVLRSRKPEARKFAKWVTSEVLPAIRKTGKYERPHNPAIDYDRISPAQAQDLKELVHAVVDAKVQGFGETWARLHKKFRVNSYLELPATRFDEARDYLLGKLPEAQHKPVSDSERIALAHSVAAEVAAQASRTVFQALLASGTSDWQHERWMFSMGYDRQNSKVLPWAAAIDRDALVASLPRLAQMISEPNGILPSDAELANLASACTQRLAQRAASRARSASIA